MFIAIFNMMGFFGFSQQSNDSTMTIDELKKMMEVDSTVVILDVRTPEELVGPLGKLDKVINIPIQELERRLNELIPFKEKEIAVICRSGNRSNFGTSILRSNGFKAKNVLGGMIEYRRKQ
ncbi:MAG: rhodanese-like domain-containing protein [Ignavibacteriaceae bacterium]|nr:rhodanese-like domain-containing protein [Ignavibacteriaceae bacterium]